VTPPDLGRRAAFLFVCAVLLAAFFAYLPSLWFQFVYDDVQQIAENPAIRSWEHVPQYFTRHVWAHLHSQTNYYRPLFLLWLRLNHALFGLEPMGWHLTTVLLHLATTLLVYLLGRRLLARRDAAAVAALLFALHPVHIESVAWVSGLTDPLLALFFTGSFLSYLRWREEKRLLCLALALLLAALALLCKESGVALPLLILAHASLYGPAARPAHERFRHALRVASPFLLLAAVYLAVRALVLSGFAHTLGEVTLATALLTIPTLLWFYAGQLLAPFGLSLFYDLPYGAPPGLMNFWLPLAGVALLAAGLYVWHRRMETPLVGLAAGLMLLPLLPAFAIHYLPLDNFAQDRYLYLPSIGFCLLAALGLSLLRKHSALLARPPAQAAALVLLAALLGGTTAAQSLHWRDNEALFRRAVAVAPGNWNGYRELANELLRQERPKEALAVYFAMAELRPSDWFTQFALGHTYYTLQEYDAAERHLRMAIRLYERNGTQFYYLARTLLARGELEQAERALARALEVLPQGKGYYYLLGQLRERQGRPREALQAYRTELRHHPGDPTPQPEIARLEAALGEAP
jgi:tetratricopeptide (TPR) repeat protein